MIQRLAPFDGHSPKSIEVIEVGSKPGEKVYEELLTEAEIPRSFEDEELIVYISEGAEAQASLSQPYLKQMRPVTDLYHSGRLPLMTASEIEAFLEGIGLLTPSKIKEQVEV
jgi:FlaA1/EpsC-like NDP-sugar epimerase